ncbi:MAG TPA: GNAT family N-acetyltransferase [Chloroflexota bacterium]|nr:GNAT family N-acetyltransferase [Chloroflexota bacterium]
MICAPGTTGVASLRAAEASDADAIQAVLEASTSHDEPSGWARGGWSVAAWATRTRVLVVEDRVVGVVAVRAETAPDGAVPARVALVPAMRQAPRAVALVQAGVDLVRETDGQRARLFVPSSAAWIQAAAVAAGFIRVRTIAHMVLPASAPTPTAHAVAEPAYHMRAILPGEDRHVLAALNRAWTGTWNFVPITIEMLKRDLDAHREGMLLAVELDRPDHIIGTCHAVYVPGEQNPDGSPRAWISNVTVDPDFRGRGIARGMLTAGIAHLRARGATAIHLGVDADNPAPFRLYTSVGFEVASSHEAWDKELPKEH